LNFATVANPSHIPVAAQGELTLTDVVVAGADTSAIVGVASGFNADAGTTAQGALYATGGSITLGSLLVGSATGGSSSAAGVLDLDGTDLQVDNLTIGQGSGATAIGVVRDATVTVGTNLGIAPNNFINETPLSGQLTLQNSQMSVGGNAVIGPGFQGGSGALELVDSEMDVADVMRIGQSSNNQTLFGDGSVRLTRSLVDVGNALVLDIGAQLDMVIDGLLRGDEYGAFDVGSAVLDGTLLVELNLVSALVGPASFDLIVSSLVDGISGDFDMVDIVGLGGGYSVFAGTVVDQIAGNDVEIYRLTITPYVPEPATLALFGLGVVAIGAVRRKKLAV
jgi:hypothetical protein